MARNLGVELSSAKILTHCLALSVPARDLWERSVTTIMWDHVLCPDTIKALYDGHKVAAGNIFDWEAHGRVEVVDYRNDNVYQLSETLVKS